MIASFLYTLSTSHNVYYVKLMDYDEYSKRKKALSLT